MFPDSCDSKLDFFYENQGNYFLQLSNGTVPHLIVLVRAIPYYITTQSEFLLENMSQS